MTDSAPQVRIQVRDLCVTFSGKPAIQHLSLDVFSKERLAIIGPASSGKTTFLRCLNRLNDLQHGFAHTGQILLDGKDIYDLETDVAQLRRRIGMVYAVPVPLPWTIYENLVYGPRLAGVRSKSALDEAVETSLRAAVLWDEVKDRLQESAHNLSGGQQQRLCLARVLALKPDVLILDEPCSGLDPVSTAKIEDALLELKVHHSIILVTNNTKQAGRSSDRTAFFLMGELIEAGPTEALFTKPRDRRTNDYLIGQFG
ncbi:MAG TPA: phosphate ABC transporter ATP-binding protein [Candidatus Hydrogenedentes bacterium]|nr:phosphate ABC transporter ATP-binding protein [Candidatus Hydrogenedentota bacterium]HPG66945.1 phosphate ABC transporter ATP-binding protein [Candidatus Hydrogenedentota bacterium]